MDVCGVDLRGSEAIIVMVSGTKDDYKLIRSDARKIPLSDHNSSDEVKEFYKIFQALIDDRGIKKVAIKKRNLRGDYAAGGVSFKIEGLIQLSQTADVLLLHPTYIGSCKRKYSHDIPNNLYKYQYGAFDIAFACLCKLES